MDILIVSKKSGKQIALNLWQKRVVGAVAALVIGLPLAAAVFGFRFGVEVGEGQPEALIAAYQDEIKQQRSQIDDARATAEANLNALTMRLGQLQAHVTRLNAMGQRLTRLSGMDKGEFDFENPPAVGGPVSENEQSEVTLPDFMGQLDSLSREIGDREEQLAILEGVLMNRSVQEDTYPAGRPLLNGWISSHFGQRTDPFTGKLDYHKGLDMAGKEGSDIVAVASGVVTWSGPRYGYGNLVEITHGNGYVTRYGHNKENVVKVGETVKKGQVVAKLGNTGRSTGPHVHFEVWRNGRTVDPIRYVRAEP